jgi:hypothetical protein
LEKDVATLALECARKASTSVTGYAKRKEQVAGMEAVKAEVRLKQPLLNHLFLKRKQQQPAGQ